LRPEQLPAFYGALDCLLMTSVNSTESFGLVQVEAMFCGTPVVATDLPGVRQPVQTTGMGLIVPIADSGALAQGIGQVLTSRHTFVRPRAEVERIYDIHACVSGYEKLFEELLNDTPTSERQEPTVVHEGESV
jgi:glycosyltransferase involved in cell wall biosynthesis